MASISLKEFWMNRDTTHKAELTPEIQAQAAKLIPKVNALLADLGLTGPVYVSSGWRPASLNAKVDGAAKASYHTKGMACDLADANGAIKKLILAKPELLKKHGLWMEDPDKTVSWCHLDSGTRSARPIQIFKI